MTALRAKGLEVQGCVCHVGDARQRRELIDATIQVNCSCDVVRVTCHAAPQLYGDGARHLPCRTAPVR